MSKKSSQGFRQKTIAHVRTSNMRIVQAADTRHTSPVVAIAPAVWFELQLVKKTAPMEKFIEVATNEHYVLTLTARTAVSSFHREEYRQGIHVSATVDLQVQCFAGGNYFVGESISLTLEEVQHLHKTYTFYLPEIVNSRKLELQLHFQLPDSDMLMLGSRTWDIPQGYKPIEKSYADKYYLVSDLPHEVAILTVMPDPDLDHDQAMVIGGRNAFQDLPEAKYRSKTIANVTNLMHIITDGDAIDIRGRIRKFSQDLPSSMKQWFMALQQKYQDKLCLIIIDQSKLETPWEMIELEEHTYIGTIACVTRWYPHQEFRNMPLDGHPVVHRGSVVYYLDKKSDDIHFEREQEVLNVLKNSEHDTLDDLVTGLSRSLADVGLIYVGCHGQKGRYLQDPQDPQWILRASHFLAMDMHTESRPIAFFNACGSGRIVYDDPYDDSSFAYAMLSRFAQGYIGTLADVGGQLASDLAGRFLQMCSEDNEQTIAEILRDLRRRAVEEIHKKSRSSRNERELFAKKMLYTFMYVYYGNPQARLCLAAHTAVNVSPQQIEETPCNNK